VNYQKTTSDPFIPARAIGLRYGIGAAAVGAIHQRLQDRPDVLQVVESLAQKLCKTRTKLNV
jgi:hypothetical protein